MERGDAGLRAYDEISNQTGHHAESVYSDQRERPAERTPSAGLRGRLAKVEMSAGRLLMQGIHEAVEAGAVGFRHLLDEGGIEPGKRLGDGLSRAREGTVGMRVV